MRRKIEVLDTHIHLTTTKLKNEWIEGETDAFRRGGVWSLKRYVDEMERSERFYVSSVIFVECWNSPAIEEVLAWTQAAIMRLSNFFVTFPDAIPPPQIQIESTVGKILSAAVGVRLFVLSCVV